MRKLGRVVIMVEYDDEVVPQGYIPSVIDSAIKQALDIDDAFDAFVSDKQIDLSPAQLQPVGDTDKLVICSMCRNPSGCHRSSLAEPTGVCDEHCWDERLRSSE